MVMKYFQYLFGLFVALIAILTARAVYAQQEALIKIDVIRLDSRFDKLVPSNVKIEKIAGGHKWVEGPVWNRRESFLLFSDIPNNSIYKWQESNGESLFLKPSGKKHPTRARPKKAWFERSVMAKPIQSLPM